MIADSIEELLHAVGNVALREGESWRLANTELMDAYMACLEDLDAKKRSLLEKP